LERANTFYPDLDDTAVALTLLLQMRDLAPTSFRQCIDNPASGTMGYDLHNPAVQKASDYVLSEQGSDGPAAQSG
jgi:squalene cyclase